MRSRERTYGRACGARVPELCHRSGMAARLLTGSADVDRSSIIRGRDRGSMQPGALAPSRAVQTASPAGLGWAGPGDDARRFLRRNMPFERIGSAARPRPHNASVGLTWMASMGA